MSSTVTTPWDCPTCRAPVASAFCPTCGEEAMGPQHLTLREFGHDAFNAVSSIDSKLLRSIRALVLKPGVLTDAYAHGQTKPYIRPLPLFLAANALFFAVESLSKVNVFATPLIQHMTRQDWSATARVLVDGHLAARGTTLAAYAPLFDQAAELNAKTLIILMPMVFCLVPAALFAGARKPVALHGVFALHLYAFLLLLFCLALGVSSVDTLLGGEGVQGQLMDKLLTAANLAICAVYLHRAVGVAYGARGLYRIAATFVLLSAVGALVLGYRFSILLITLWGS